MDNSAEETHLEPVPICVNHDIAENKAEVAQNDVCCQEDIRPVLWFTLLDFLIELPEDQLAQRNHQRTQRDVVDLGVHDGRHGHDAVVWAPGFVWGLKGWEFALAHTPRVLDEACSYPKGQGIGHKSVLDAAY